MTLEMLVPCETLPAVGAVDGHPAVINILFENI